MQHNKIIAAGTVVNLYGPKIQPDSNVIFRLNNNGSLDKTFGIPKMEPMIHRLE